jgi:hypothetical protein
MLDEKVSLTAFVPRWHFQGNFDTSVRIIGQFTLHCVAWSCGDVHIKRKAFMKSRKTCLKCMFFWTNRYRKSQMQASAPPASLCVCSGKRDARPAPWEKVNCPGFVLNGGEKKMLHSSVCYVGRVNTVHMPSSGDNNTCEYPFWWCFLSIESQTWGWKALCLTFIGSSTVNLRMSSLNIHDLPQKTHVWKYGM